ncbi:ataxin-10 [Halyomorpha halys]|uniref:ataxin-10 n=1 Tax=Halyomorpha halys TaxID=286706 RepID=UPI000D0C94EC|nr:ataxin-10-like [Halyomorpha halys]XP_024216586.1 ataxin-10-like [Halyomorpha halys]
MFQEHITVLEPFITKEVTDFDSGILYTTFRQLRNLCTTGPDVQSELCQNEVFNHTIIIVDRMIKDYSETLLPALKQGLQFIYNLSVNNEENKPTIWAKYSFLKSWMTFQSDESIRNYVCGTLYNIVLNPMYTFQAYTDITLMNSIIDSAVKGADFPLLFIENLFQSDTEETNRILTKLFDSDDTSHFYLLTLLLEYVKDNDINEHFINLIRSKFESKVSCAVSDSNGGSELQEIYVLMKILMELSVKSAVIPKLQKNVGLLDSSKSLLEFIHVKGKDKDSEFAPTEDIFPERSKVENLKANVIRLIANLCWKNKVMQDRVRETGCLPIILDSCVRDGKNPFITETSIYAIRNLCELNVENQKLIRNLNCEVYNEVVERMNNRSNLYIDGFTS